MESFFIPSAGALYRLHPEDELPLIIELALAGSVRLLICGNRLPFYAIAYQLARRVGQQYVYFLQERIFFARAETVIQLVDLLGGMAPDPVPLLVSDLLARFVDEAPGKADACFFQCLVELRRLSREAPVFVSAPARPSLQRLGNALLRTTRPLPFHL